MARLQPRVHTKLPLTGIGHSIPYEMIALGDFLTENIAHSFVTASDSAQFQEKVSKELLLNYHS